MKTVVFFNNKGGVGKTSLVYHLAWMLSEMGHRAIAVDLDPQSNLTSAFLVEERLEELWPDGHHDATILGAVRPLLEHLGDFQPIHVQPITDHLALVPGDLGLSTFEDRLAAAWTGCQGDNQVTAADAFRVMTAFYRVMTRSAHDFDSDLALVDVGPNLGALNRAALVAADYVVVPLGADLFSLQGLKNLGPTLREWRTGWEKRKRENAPGGLVMPSGAMLPIGYVVLQPAVRQDRPVKAYRKWAERIPGVYASEVLAGLRSQTESLDGGHHLADLKHFKSLMPLAQDARKPMFLLKPADGAIGGHTAAVKACYKDFEQLASRILERCGLPCGRLFAS